MKVIISGLMMLLALNASVSAQLALDNDGFYVTDGSDFSFEGLQFIANGDQHINNVIYTLSNDSTSGGNYVSLDKVIMLSVPFVFNGTFRFLYPDDMNDLNGNTESMLDFLVRSGGVYDAMESSTVDSATNIVTWVTGSSVSLDRFSATNGNEALPLAKYSFTAGVTPANVKLQWLVEENDFYKGFQLEESENGIDWKTITYINALPTDKQVYTYNDANATFNKRFYRLRLDAKTGGGSYSEIITVTNGSKSKKTLIVTDRNSLTVNYLQGNVPDQFLLLDNVGRIVYKSLQREHQYHITNLRTGVYVISYKLQGQSYTEKVMVK